MAIIFKKQIEYQRDYLALGININQIQEAGVNAVSTRCLNNQRWNQYICSNSGTILLVLVIFSITSSKLLYYMLNNSNLNEHEKMLLQNLVFVGIILNLGIPLYIYAKNNKLIKHLKHEIMYF